MKEFIKKLLRETLDEMTPKPVFGQGDFHKIYHSVKHPDRLYKVGDEETVDGWVDTFKRYPKYFPKVYRVFPYAKNPIYTVVEIEKLETSQASLELKKIDKFLIDWCGNIECGNDFVSILNFFEDECWEEVEYIAEKKSPEILPLLNKWGNFLSEVTPLVQRDTFKDLDLHFGNVAYDAQGNIKLIDI